MAIVSIPIERFLFGNEHWRSYRAMDEVAIYCDLIEDLQFRIDSLETRGKDEEVSLTNVQAVISSYALEIAMKSLWALDNPTESVPHKHNLVTIFDGLNAETVKSLKQLQLTRDVLGNWPTPFVSNRYSMEGSSRDLRVYQARFLRSLIELLRDKLEETREGLLKPPQAPTARRSSDPAPHSRG